MFNVENIQQDTKYQQLAEEIGDPEDFPAVRDAEFFIHKSGLIVNAEGWYHPSGSLVGEVLYAPDDGGNKNIFGQKYRKVSLYPGTYTPVPYNKRSELLAKYDKNLANQVETNPFYARYKQIFSRSDFVAYLPSREVFQKLLRDFAVPGDDILLDLENLEQVLGIDLKQVAIGITGANLLGNVQDYHDLDLVFQGTTAQNIEIAKRMRQIVIDEPERRLTEGGKGWNIRFYNDRQKLMCNFFGYSNPQEAPLINFAMDVIEDDIQIEGTVVDDLHTIYTPTILGLKDVIFTRLKNDKVSERCRDIPLIVYHTATRGECFNGDRIKASGSYVEVTTKEGKYEAVCSIEREDVRNLTPTWEGFYQD